MPSEYSRKTRVVLGAFLAVAALATPALAENSPGELLVSAVQGKAEYSTDHHVWYPLEAGLVLGPGAELRTTTNTTADLVLKHCGTALRLMPESLLTLTRLEEIFTGEEILTATKLDLRAGSLIGSQRKLSKTSTFEIATPVATATIRGTEYVVRADGAVSCLNGAVSVKYISGHGPPVNVHVPAGYSFDPATRQVVVTTSAYLQHLIAHVTAVRDNAQVFKVGKSKVIVKPEHKVSPVCGDGGDDGDDHGHHGGDDNGHGHDGHGHDHGHGGDHQETFAHAFLVPNP